MPTNRFFYKDPLQQGQSILLAGEEYAHLKVMRPREGEKIELVSGSGQLAHALVQALERHAAHLLIESVEQEKKPFSLILAQAFIKQPKLEWVVEKATELGASEIWLFPGELSERDKLSSNHLQRLHQLTIAAMKQCGRLYLPQIVEKPPLSQWNQVEGELLFSDLDMTAPFLWEQRLGASTPILLIGPESGFSSSEKNIALGTLHAKPVRLHTNTLRAETASLVALALMQTLMIRS